MEKKKKLFDLVLSVSQNGERIATDLTCTKDGQNHGRAIQVSEAFD